MNLILPYPPSENRYRRVVGYMPVISKEGRLYKDRVKTLIRVLELPRLTGPVSVQLVLAPPDKRKRDLDNTLKAMFDAISDEIVKKKGVVVQTIPGMIENDSQIVDLQMSWSMPVQHGSVLMTITETDDRRTAFGDILEAVQNNGDYIFDGTDSEEVTA